MSDTYLERRPFAAGMGSVIPYSLWKGGIVKRIGGYSRIAEKLRAACGGLLIEKCLGSFENGYNGGILAVLDVLGFSDRGSRPFRVNGPGWCIVRAIPWDYVEGLRSRARELHGEHLEAIDGVLGPVDVYYLLSGADREESPIKLGPAIKWIMDKLEDDMRVMLGTFDYRRDPWAR